MYVQRHKIKVHQLFIKVQVYQELIQYLLFVKELFVNYLKHSICGKPNYYNSMVIHFNHDSWQCFLIIILTSIFIIRQIS